MAEYPRPQEPQKTPLEKYGPIILSVITIVGSIISVYVGLSTSVSLVKQDVSNIKEDVKELYDRDISIYDDINDHRRSLDSLKIEQKVIRRDLDKEIKTREKQYDETRK